VGGGLLFISNLPAGQGYWAWIHVYINVPDWKIPRLLKLRTQFPKVGVDIGQDAFPQVASPALKRAKLPW
jgi:hypothetical protein